METNDLSDVYVDEHGKLKVIDGDKVYLIVGANATEHDMALIGQLEKT